MEPLQKHQMAIEEMYLPQFAAFLNLAECFVMLNRTSKTQRDRLHWLT